MSLEVKEETGRRLRAPSEEAELVAFALVLGVFKVVDCVSRFGIWQSADEVVVGIALRGRVDDNLGVAGAVARTFARRRVRSRGENTLELVDDVLDLCEQKARSSPLNLYLGLGRPDSLLPSFLWARKHLH